MAYKTTAIKSDFLKSSITMYTCIRIGEYHSKEERKVSRMEWVREIKKIGAINTHLKADERRKVNYI